MKTIYITWHYTTHGVAYLKHVLSAFYVRCKDLPQKIEWLQIEKEGIEPAFSEQKKGFLFDEIVYLTAPQATYDVVSSRIVYRKNVLQDPFVEHNKELRAFYEDLIDKFPEHNLKQEIEFIKERYPNFLNDFQNMLWRNIQFYTIADQIYWLSELSNFHKVYQGKLKVIELGIKDLRNEKEIANVITKNISKYFKEQKKDYQAIINVSLGTSETQVVWHILAEVGMLPDKVRFIKAYDDEAKTPKEKRFKNFSIKEIPTNLISNIGREFKIFETTTSRPRELVNRKVKNFLTTGFAILLIGERGTGKSQIASEAKEQLKKLDKPIQGKLIEANCASFADDTIAESELFGYVKGAFTGANSDKKGLIEEAKEGILFLDEIHHLSKRVQAKLMKALQTNQNNELSIRRLGDNKEIKVKDVRLIFATNKTIEELRELLLPDFYDRIVQHVVEIPPLRETREDLEKDWENIWKQLQFSEPIPQEKSLMDWLKTLPLYGNFRDLQKIAMYYNAFNQFDEETQKLISEKTAFEYAKNEFVKYHSPATPQVNSKYNFDIQKKTKEMIAEYKYELQKWAVKEFGGRKKAIEHFRELGDKVTEKTFNNWKNRYKD